MQVSTSGLRPRGVKDAWLFMWYSMKRYPIAILMLGGLLATHLLYRADEVPAPLPSNAHAPDALKLQRGMRQASAIPDTPAASASAPAQITPVGQSAAATKFEETDAPSTAISERMLIAGDALAGQCALQTLWDADRFSELLQTLRREVAGDAGVEAQRRAITEAYREAINLSGGGAELVDSACGAHLCAVTIRLPADTADDEVREAMVGRLLGGLVVVGTQVSVASADGTMRENRRIFSVSDEVSRLGPRQCSE